MNWIFGRIMPCLLICGILKFPVFAEQIPYYIITDGGYVAIYDTQKEKICRTRIPVALLPPSDAELLRKGLPCTDERELAQAIENFTS